MKVTATLLNMFLTDHAAAPRAIADAWTALGHEVEHLFDPHAVYAGFVAARIVDAQPHPQADRLQVCSVDAGGAAPLQIVCGAPNARAGLHTVLALPGAVIPADGSVLKAGKVRGVESQGMMCSARELGIEDDFDGIVELPADALPGTPLADLPGRSELIWTLSLTPDRPDALGVLGLAEDLAAAGIGRRIAPDLSVLGVKAADIAPQSVDDLVRIEAPELCPHFIAVRIEGVQDGPAPEALQRQLRACGITPFSAAVDVTNLFSRLYARPLHVFDADALRGPLRVRASRAGESFTALNDKTYVLPAGLPVIADDASVCALAGVIGGRDSAVHAGTRNIVLEAAYFTPARVGSAGRLLGIATDARLRFERGIDPAFTAPAAAAAASLIVGLCGGTATARQEIGHAPEGPPALSVPKTTVQRLTGSEPAPEEQERLLRAVGCTVTAEGEVWRVQPPTRRPDLLTPADIVGEIVRLRGVADLPEVPLPAAPALPPADSRERTLRVFAAARGLHECITWSFIAPGDTFGIDTPGPENPISVDMSRLRPSLLPGLLSAAARNAAYGLRRQSVFEIGNIWNAAGEQTSHAAVLRVGEAAAVHHRTPPRSVDVLDLKADAEALLNALGVKTASLKTLAEAPVWGHPGRSGALALGRRVLARFGEIHPRVLQHFDLQLPAAAAVIDVSEIPELRESGKPAETPKLQPLRRDFSFTLPAALPMQTLLTAVRKGAGPLCVGVELFDLYRGAGLPPEVRSAAVRVLLQPQQRALSDDELTQLQADVVREALKVGGQLRG